MDTCHPAGDRVGSEDTVEEATKTDEATLQTVGDLSDKLVMMALEGGTGDEAVSALCVAGGRAAGLGGAELGEAVVAFCRAFELGAYERSVELVEQDLGPPPAGEGD
jgi:hypothetical protein